MFCLVDLFIVLYCIIVSVCFLREKHREREREHDLWLVER